MRTSLVALLIGAGLGIAGCSHETGPPASGVSSSAPNAVDSAASGTTGGGANKFTPAQISPGSPAANP